LDLSVRDSPGLTPFVRSFRDPELARLWWAEVERYEYEWRDWEAVCANPQSTKDWYAG
jgi:hypothetical protein